MSETDFAPPVYRLHHHPAVKWVLMVAMLSVAGLSLPHGVSAASPAVQAPTGPQTNGVFTGTFTFVYYMYCSNGANYSSSYSSNLDGTNTFDFYGAADGSLLLRINGGGYQLLNSCGDPYNSDSGVASYTVSKNTAPTPTPTPVPTPTPTPTPTPAPTVTTGGGTSGGSSGGSGSSGTHTVTTTTMVNGRPVTTTVTDTPSPTPTSAATPSPSSTPVAAPAGLKPSPQPRVAPPTTDKRSPLTVLASKHLWLMLGLLLVLAGITFAVVVEWSELRRRSAVLGRAIGWRLEPIWFRLKLAFHHHGTTEPRRKGLSHHRYSGRLLAHHHTSYPTLVFLLLVGTMAVSAVSLTSHAADATLSLSVSGPAPTVGASIDDPIDGTTFTNNIITVRGTCPNSLRVELTRDGVFAGSTICDSTGNYSVVISLVDGANLLLASDYDAAAQAGPATAGVTVTYVPPVIIIPVIPTPTPAAGSSNTSNGSSKSAGGSVVTPTPASTVGPFIISVDQHFFSGFAPGENFSWPADVSGGRAPYQVTATWGDQSSTTISLVAPGSISPTHSYLTGGIYHISLNATDAQGRHAVMSMVAVVSGAPLAAVSSGSGSTRDNGVLSLAWPVLIGATLVVLSFWLGERDRTNRLRRALELSTS
ncbi:hypothetical protein HJC99_06460 [Candidatus Saccharibacteria bacterium]|nr:hypothetical protein [Candidatus Saccharibacteria bacterium]